MKLEWCLQAIEARNPVTPVFLVSLPLPERERQQWPELDDMLRLAATANDAHFANGFFHRTPLPLTPATFDAAVRPHLLRVMVLP